MKKINLPILLIALVVAMTSGLSSCNKKLKKELEELDKSVSDLKGSNTELQNQLANTQNQISTTSQLIGSNEPITATTTWIDDNNVQQTYADTYSWKASSYNTHYMEENSDGTYDIYIERFSDVDWNEGAWIFFTYNPSTGAKTNKRLGQYWEWNLAYNNETRFDETYTGATVNITINSINISTGDISLSVTGTGDATFVSTYPSYSINNIGPVSTTFNFTGKLKVFPLQ